MNPDLCHSKFKIAPELQTAVFARKGKGHGVSRRTEDADGETWVYITDSLGKKYRVILEIRDTLMAGRVVYMTVYSGIFVSRSATVMDEIFKCNAVVRGKGAEAPVISISDERDELIVERCIPLDDNVSRSLRMAETDCIGLGIALERHFNEIYRPTLRTVIEEEC